MDRKRLLGELIGDMNVKVYQGRPGRRPKPKMLVMRIESLTTGKVTVIENKPQSVREIEEWLDAGKPGGVLPK